MIVSHKHKFVFVKIPKTAGESFVSVLEQYAAMDLWNTDLGNHERYSDIILENRDFEKYFSFAFVRNPYELKVSRYFYVKEVEKVCSCTSFVEWVTLGSPVKMLDETQSKEDWFPWSQLRFLMNKERELAVDFIGRFENLQEDFNTICDKIGIPRQQLPHKNKSKHKHYTEYYDDETREIVAEKYAKDIDHFGYEFGE